MPCHQPFNFIESAAYGSLISATDPVSVLAIFKELHADQTLYILVIAFKRYLEKAYLMTPLLLYFMTQSNSLPPAMGHY
jgi:hypothetical protein